MIIEKEIKIDGYLIEIKINKLLEIANIHVTEPDDYTWSMERLPIKVALMMAESTSKELLNTFAP